MTNKIIWTTKELEEMMEEALVSEDLPLCHVTAAPRSRAEVTEISQVEGAIPNVIVYLPPGVRDLVWVSVYINDISFLEPVGGDNQYYTIETPSDIKLGDTIKVRVKNFDKEFAHTVGVRVEVEEGPAEVEK